MKKWLVILVMLFISAGVFAQEHYNSSGKKGNTSYKPNQKEKGFNTDKLIFGGGIGGGMGSGSVAVMVSPIIGYRITDYFSAGVSLGYMYWHQKDYFGVYNTNTSSYDLFNLNAHTFAPGVWTRFVPLDFLFVHLEYEHNLMTFKNYEFGSNNQPNSFREWQSVPCLLVGGGYRQPITDRASFVIYGLYDVLQNIPSNMRTDPSTGTRYSISPYARRLDIRMGVNFGF